jgi:hypothetical protein
MIDGVSGIGTAVVSEYGIIFEILGKPMGHLTLACITCLQIHNNVSMTNHNIIFLDSQILIKYEQPLYFLGEQTPHDQLFYGRTPWHLHIFELLNNSHKFVCQEELLTEIVG